MAKKEIITLRVDVEGLKRDWKEDRGMHMLRVLELCGFDNDFIDEISKGVWKAYKKIIGKKLKIGERGLE